MKKTLLLLALVAVFGFVVANVSAEAPSDQVRIAKLVTEMTAMPADQLAALEPLAVRQWELPPPGVDVMRARLSETYYVEGVGEDTVELTGWVAVKHFNTRPAEGFTELTWNTAVTTTEFVGMGLTGNSELFGRVEIGLNGEQTQGSVGHIELPANARMELLKLAAREDTGTSEAEAEAGACTAPVEVAVSMPDIGIQMVTAEPVLWHSLVDTIPPVGTTASVTVEPMPMLMDGRQVGTLVSGTVDFREVVRHLPLIDAPSYGQDEIAAVAQ